ncbi:MAG: hypothetical protein CMJ18_25105 [Phycisphaeraceae bacterium]|nr:hypothetical protein [Phycisphaeraceae bacterium]
MLGACSADKHVVRSTVFKPASVAIRDLVSKEIIWSYDVPVQHKLHLNFNRSGEYVPITYADRPAEVMIWSLYDEISGRKVAKGVERMPGVPIIMERSYRKGPELPPVYESTPVDAGIGEDFTVTEAPVEGGEIAEPDGGEMAIEAESAAGDASEAADVPMMEESADDVAAEAEDEIEPVIEEVQDAADAAGTVTDEAPVGADDVEPAVEIAPMEEVVK